MNTRFWIPLAVVGYSLMLPLGMCYGHYRPVKAENDINEHVRIDVLSQALSASSDPSRLASGEVRGLNACSKDLTYAYLATRSHPDLVVYRVKDVCDPDDCACHIKTSYLEQRRADLSVPWHQAGKLLPTEARR